jgi:hypothetical protein
MTVCKLCAQTFRRRTDLVELVPGILICPLCDCIKAPKPKGGKGAGR